MESEWIDNLMPIDNNLLSSNKVHQLFVDCFANFKAMRGVYRINQDVTVDINGIFSGEICVLILTSCVD